MRSDEILDEPAWEEPGETFRTTKWSAVLRPLMEHPKRWACVARYSLERAPSAASAAQAIRQKNVAGDLGGFEATTRRHEDHVALYVRYLGEDDAA